MQPQLHEKMFKLMAPSIYGHDDIRKAVACLLFEGARKVKLAVLAAPLAAMHVQLVHYFRQPNAPDTLRHNRVDQLHQLGVCIQPLPCASTFAMCIQPCCMHPTFAICLYTGDARWHSAARGHPCAAHRRPFHCQVPIPQVCCTNGELHFSSQPLQHLPKHSSNDAMLC